MINKKKALGALIVLLVLFLNAGFLYSEGFSFIENNELMVNNRIRSISSAILSYAEANNGKMPSDFLSDLVNVTPPYLSQDYANTERDGYKYSIEFYPDGYKVIANPVFCGKTGNKIFVLEARREEVAEITSGQKPPVDLEIKEFACE